MNIRSFGRKVNSRFCRGPFRAVFGGGRGREAREQGRRRSDVEARSRAKDGTRATKTPTSAFTSAIVGRRSVRVSQNSTSDPASELARLPERTKLPGAEMPHRPPVRRARADCAPCRHPPDRADPPAPPSLPLSPLVSKAWKKSADSFPSLGQYRLFRRNCSGNRPLRGGDRRAIDRCPVRRDGRGSRGVEVRDEGIAKEHALQGVEGVESVLAAGWRRSCGRCRRSSGAASSSANRVPTGCGRREPRSRAGRPGCRWSGRGCGREDCAPSFACGGPSVSGPVSERSDCAHNPLARYIRRS